MKEISSSNSISNEIEKDSNDEVRELVDSFNSYIRKLKQVIALDAIVIEETAAAPVEVKSIVKSNIQKVQQMSSLANDL